MAWPTVHPTRAVDTRRFAYDPASDFVKHLIGVAWNNLMTFPDRHQQFMQMPGEGVTEREKQYGSIRGPRWYDKDKFSELVSNMVMPIKAVGSAPMIFKNILGNPEPTATISGFGKIGDKTKNISYGYGPPSYWSLSTLAQTPLKGRRFESFDDALRFAEQEGFEITTGKDLSGDPIAKLLHRPTQNILDELVSKQNNKWANAQNVYIRYGDIPASGRSRNYADGVLEKGVSVYRGKYLPETDEIMITPSHHYQEFGELFIKDRPAYIVVGEEVGIGSDGEPLLSGVRKVKKITGKARK